MASGFLQERSLRPLSPSPAKPKGIPNNEGNPPQLQPTARDHDTSVGIITVASLPRGAEPPCDIARHCAMMRAGSGWSRLEFHCLPMLRDGKINQLPAIGVSPNEAGIQSGCGTP